MEENERVIVPQIILMEHMGTVLLNLYSKGNQTRSKNKVFVLLALNYFKLSSMANDRMNRQLPYKILGFEDVQR